MLDVKLQRMTQLFKELGSVLVAYSGGIDSTLVMKVAHDALGPKAIAVTAVSPTFPEIELETARRVAAQVGAHHLIVDTNQLASPDFVRNEADRCYHCKTDLYQGLAQLQRDLKIGAMVDGTNLDDLGDDRPGMTAAKEWGVRSPLVEAALSKEEVRTLAKTLGLSNWDKPAAACLSSRIPRGVAITQAKLSRIERAEAALFREGLRQFRVRDHGEVARIEVAGQELPAMLDEERRARVTAALKALGFRFVTLDLDGYRRGGGNKT
ncbi:MAG: ATP-dependent sacrificial sulfur transferase LarE [Nitrospirae bacterium]|nr:MAG: ATP-dependent sacrificial sulfur transferase LarE [Nitrospirota bacterium]